MRKIKIIAPSTTHKPFSFTPPLKPDGKVVVSSQMGWSDTALIRMAKRRNNSKREYLYVNPMQAKHLPSDPRQTFHIGSALAYAINAAHPDDRLYVIGLAETATGISACTCRFLKHAVYYQTTTREPDSEDEVLYFTESHSHATEQMLRIAKEDLALEAIDRFVFIDDEVTTGNTICKLIKNLKKRFKIPHAQFTIAAVLSSLTDTRERQLSDAGIDVISLLRIPHEWRKEEIKNIEHHPELEYVPPQKLTGTVKNPFFKTMDAYCNPRMPCPSAEYQEEVWNMAEEICDPFRGNDFHHILVLGTEECMYPAIAVGKHLQIIGKDAKVQATTRSPIAISNAEGYPIRSGTVLRSMYNPLRNTYVYNLEPYDAVLVVTDAVHVNNVAAGIQDLQNALENAGNKNIFVFRIRYIKKDNL